MVAVDSFFFHKENHRASFLGTLGTPRKAGYVGAGVIVGSSSIVSQHPQKKPGASQLVELCGVVCDVSVAVGRSVISLHPPNHPGVSQEDVDVGTGVLVVMIGAGVADGVGVVVVLSLHQNQPGVSHVVVVVAGSVVVIGSVVWVPVVVVVSSRHPHQPGVWHVEVLVSVDVVDVGLVVVESEPLLSKNFQLKQSTQSLSGAQTGTSSYFSITSVTTLRIR